uniref:RING-type domain-containing protein n=1 Tax=Prasinoderma singulare TaxID=676789 RepID=A0A7S3FEE8_9VIRI|mmetsp:Transcript_22844/g.70567  ORF Transcript_22844/g.70567 Transcript_22844/m.70567 type:complete len:286 (+) Transcript_22844:1048-1905(+)
MALRGRQWQWQWQNGLDLDAMSYEERLERFPGNTPPRPLSDAAIACIPVSCAEKVAGTQGSKCVICLNKFRAKQAVRELPGCCHVFHKACVDQWLRTQRTCPVCRIIVEPPPEPPEEMKATAPSSAARVGGSEQTNASDDASDSAESWGSWSVSSEEESDANATSNAGHGTPMEGTGADGDHDLLASDASIAATPSSTSEATEATSADASVEAGWVPGARTVYFQLNEGLSAEPSSAAQSDQQLWPVLLTRTPRQERAALLLRFLSSEPPSSPEGRMERSVSDPT